MKNKYVFLVYCNVEPLVYAIFKSKQNAVKYALDLIRYRKGLADVRGYKFGYFHFEPYVSKWQLSVQKDDIDFKYTHYTVFSVCLRIEDDLNSKVSDNGCIIKVERRILSDKY